MRLTARRAGAVSVFEYVGLPRLGDDDDNSATNEPGSLTSKCDVVVVLVVRLLDTPGPTALGMSCTGAAVNGVVLLCTNGLCKQLGRCVVTTEEEAETRCCGSQSVSVRFIGFLIVWSGVVGAHFMSRLCIQKFCLLHIFS